MHALYTGSVGLRLHVEASSQPHYQQLFCAVLTSCLMRLCLQPLLLYDRQMLADVNCQSTAAVDLPQIFAFRSSEATASTV